MDTTKDRASASSSRPWPPSTQSKKTNTHIPLSTTTSSSSTPPAAGGGSSSSRSKSNWSNRNNPHDSLVAPLQPVALDHPISPARDTAPDTDFDDTEDEDTEDETEDEEDEEEEEEAEEEEGRSDYGYRYCDDNRLPTLPEVEDMSSSGFLHGMPMRSARDEEWGGEPTPTPWDRRLEGDGMPDGNILEWDTEGVVGWIVSLGLGKYQETLLG